MLASGAKLPVELGGIASVNISKKLPSNYYAAPSLLAR
jgi:hypothetical protein